MRDKRPGIAPRYGEGPVDSEDVNDEGHHRATIASHSDRHDDGHKNAKQGEIDEVTQSLPDAGVGSRNVPGLRIANGAGRSRSSQTNGYAS